MAYFPLKTHLKYCLEIARQKNISKAAKILGITQPQLTKSLQSLEQDIGFKLFDRTNRGLLTTPQGKQFFQHIEDLEQYWIQKSDSPENLPSLFRIAAHPLIAAGFLPQLAKQVRNHFPLLNLQYLERNSKDISHLVSSREIELGIAADPTPLQGLVLSEIRKDVVAIWSAGENKDLLVVNPQMAQFSRLLRRSKYRQIIEIDNYSIAARTAIELQCHCLLPEPATYKKNFKKVKTLENISIKMVYRQEFRSNPLIERIRSILI
jgi:DNA-binding transcriptional LysR family regulator